MVHRHLDGEALAKLGSLQLRVKAAVDGALAGLHRSIHRGSSVEFAEHKEYSPGDDLRRLDWQAYAKYDRYYIRQFENETETRAYLLLDCSGSMEYGEPISKLNYASTLIGSLAYLLHHQRDQPALLTYGSEGKDYIPPHNRRSHLPAIFNCLENTQADGETDLNGLFNHILGVAAPRSLVVVVTDLLDPDLDLKAMLRQLRARKHQVVLFHLLDDDELELPFSSLTLFQSMEDKRQIMVDPAGIRRAYLREMRAFLDRVKGECQSNEVDYYLCRTSDQLDVLLRRFLRGGRP
jgi:uncharacterized protein (DUF58 family)